METGSCTCYFRATFQCIDFIADLSVFRTSTYSISEVGPGPFLENFPGGLLSLHVLTKKGVADDIWAWPIKFAMLYTMKLWRYGKA